MLRLLFYKTLTVKPYKRYRKLFSKRVRLISSKQNAAKHKSCDLRCYCEQTGYAKHRLLNLKVSSQA